MNADSTEMVVVEAAQNLPAVTDQGMPKPGVHAGISIRAYHALDGISKTGLDAIDRSPAHYYGRYLDPKRPPADEETTAQLEGNLAHCAILEPAEFHRRYVVTPKDAPRRPTSAQWNAKNPSADSIVAMKWWREFNERTGGKQVITAEQYDRAMRQSDSVRSISEIDKVLEQSGHAEVSAIWVDPLTGELCRCRPDFVAEYGTQRVVLLDVKTFSDASAREFRRQAARMRYHVQDSYYSDGYALASGLDVMGFVFIVVENEWPYAANALMFDDPSKDQGRTDYRRNLDAYARCRRDNEWPGYGPEVKLIDLPAWAFTE